MTIHAALSRKNVAPVAFAVTFVLTLVLWRIDGELTGGSGESSLYLQLAFSNNRFESVLASWRSGGLDIFVSTLWLNFVYAISYSVLLASAPLYFSKRHGGFGPDRVTARDTLFFSLPFCAGACDWIVHAFYIILFGRRFADESLIRAISAVAILKWLLIAVSIILVMRSFIAARRNKKG